VVDPSAPRVLAQHAIPTERIVVDDERVWVVSEGGNVTAVDPTTGELTPHSHDPDGHPGHGVAG
jgi:outer membrane protein assembly factor BamB